MNWQDFTNLVSRAGTKVQEFRDIPNRASDIAEMAYPDSARDASTKNAYRHALGTGMMTQALGGSGLAAGVAKMAGWGWELPTLLNPRATEAQRIDSRHDLNANAIGSQMGKLTSNQSELEMALRGFADRSVVREPPGAFQRGTGYLTRSVR